MKLDVARKRMLNMQKFGAGKGRSAKVFQLVRFRGKNLER
jgi:hypothetical protein